MGCSRRSSINSGCTRADRRVLPVGIAHTVVPDLGLTIVVWHGDVTEDDSVNHLLQLAEDPSWPPGLLHLTDMRTVGKVTLPDPELLALLFDGSHWRDEELEKVVIVAAELFRSTTVEDAAAALGMHATIFGDVASACAHLRIDATPVVGALDQLRSEIEQRTRRQ
jgi:hypothetical protein